MFGPTSASVGVGSVPSFPTGLPFDGEDLGNLKEMT